MKRKILLRRISDLLDRDARKRRKHRDELRALLKKLRKKEIELNTRMQDETSKQKRKLLGKQLEIVRAQLEKGEKTLLEIDAS